MIDLSIASNQTKEVIDITAEITEQLDKHKFKDGLCHLFVAHTTAALTTADLDPGTDLDMLDFFSAITPKLKFRHPHNPTHVPDHILSSMIGTHVVVPVINGELVLGEWQRIVLIEFDGPRQRRVILSFA